MNELAIRDERQYLAAVSEVRDLVERIESVEGAKDLADRARAAQVWAQRARLGQEQVNLAACAKLWAERRAGELLRDTPKQTGGDAMRARSQSVTEVVGPPTLADLGVSKHESSRWQRLARIPQEQFVDAVEVASAQGIVSTARVTALAEQKFEQRVQGEFFPAPTPVFDAFWKCCGLLIQKVRADWAEHEEWDDKTRDLVRRWAPEMVKRINDVADTVAQPHELRVIEGGADAHQ